MIPKGVYWLRRVLLIAFSVENLFSCLYNGNSSSSISCIIGVDGVSIVDTSKNSKGIRGTGSDAGAGAGSTNDASPHDNEYNGNSSNGDDLIRIPLIPHHVQKERVRQRQRAMRQLNNLFEEEDSNSNSGEEIRKAEGVGALYQGYGTHYVDL